MGKLYHVADIIKELGIDVAVESTLYEQGVVPKSEQFVAFMVSQDKVDELERRALVNSEKALIKGKRKKNTALYESESITVGAANTLLLSENFFQCLRPDTVVNIQHSKKGHVFCLVSPEVFSEHVRPDRNLKYVRPRIPPGTIAQAGLTATFDSETFGSLSHAILDAGIRIQSPAIYDAFQDAAIARLKGENYDYYITLEDGTSTIYVTNNDEVIDAVPADDKQDGERIESQTSLDDMSHHFRDAVTDALECGVATVFTAQSGSNVVRIMFAPSSLDAE